MKATYSVCLLIAFGGAFGLSCERSKSRSKNEIPKMSPGDVTLLDTYCSSADGKEDDDYFYFHADFVAKAHEFETNYRRIGAANLSEGEKNSLTSKVNEDLKVCVDYIAASAGLYLRSMRADWGFKGNESHINDLKSYISDYVQAGYLDRKIPAVAEMLEMIRSDGERELYLTNPLFPICKNNFRTKLWAQIAIDTESAQRILQSEGADKQNVRVAVIDSGFNQSKNAALMASRSLKLIQGNLMTDQPGNPDMDEAGHGTAVAGTIGGKDGIGIAPLADLSVYRVTPKGDEGRVSGEVISKAIRQACDDGNEIINVSWGSTKDEAGESTDEETNAELLEYLSDHGCLVTKSAGNDSYRSATRHQKWDAEDSLLRVAAAAPGGFLADFSASGEITAPGGEIFTLASADVKNPVSDERQCIGTDGKTERGQFINGTSFSAPIVAGIAANVLLLMKANGLYDNFTPRQRIVALNRIMAAGQSQGIVNAHRVLKVVQAWGALPKSDEILSVHDLNGLITKANATTCEVARQLSCDTDQDLAQLKSCLVRIKEQISVCGNHSNQGKELFSTFLRYDNLELSLFHLSTLSPRDLTSKHDRDLVRHFANRSLYQSSGYSKPNLQFHTVLTFFPILMEIGSISKDTKFKKAISDVLRQWTKSYEFSYVLSARWNRGTDTLLAASMAVLDKAATLLSQNEVEALVMDSMTWTAVLYDKNPKEKRLFPEDIGEYIAFIRIANYIEANRKVTKLASLKSKLDRWIHQRILKPNLAMPSLAAFAREKIDNRTLVLGDSRDIEIEDIEIFLSRNHKGLATFLNQKFPKETFWYELNELELIRRGPQWWTQDLSIPPSVKPESTGGR